MDITDNFFDSERLVSYWKQLKQATCWKQYYDHEKNQPVFIQTMDDSYLEEQLVAYIGAEVPVTLFLLPFYLHSAKHFVDDLPEEQQKFIDIQLHYDKGHGPLEDQIYIYKQVFKKYPLAVRIHRLAVRELGLDLLNLGMNGVSIDSSTCGTTPPYAVNVEDRLVPVVEIPITFVDWPIHSIRDRPTCARSVTMKAVDYMEEYRCSHTVVVSLYHPTTPLEYHFPLAMKAKELGYKLTTISEYYTHLRKC